MLDQLAVPHDGHCGLTKLGPWATRVEDPFVLAPPEFEPYPTPDAIENACRRSLNAADMLFDCVTEAIPREVETAAGLPRRFWEAFLSCYLVSVAGFVEDIRTRCACLSGRNLFYGAPANDVPEPPQDIGEYFGQCLSRSALRISLMDACVRCYLPCAETRLLKYREEGPATNPAPSWSTHPSRLMMAGAMQVAKVLAKRRGTGVILWTGYKVRWPDLIRLGWIGLTPFRLAPRYCRIPHVRANPALRIRLFGSLAPPYSTVLQQTFPVIALEGLDTTLEAGRHIIKNLSGRTRQIYTAGQIWSTYEPIRAAVSLLAAEGAELISMQHGGGYGVYRVSPWAFTEFRRSDVFVSWGWKDTPQALGAPHRIAPLPSLYLSRLAARPALPAKWQALLLVFSENLYPKWLYSPIFPEQAHDYFHRQKVLLDGLRSVPSVAVKLYPYEFGWRQNECISRRYPEFTMLSQGAFVDWARRARICIVDYNSTGFLEALAMGRPFLATWNRRWFCGTDPFEQHLDRLRRVGVFHEEPEVLMKTYADIATRVEAWWAEPARLDAVAAMADEFARVSPDPIGALQQFMVGEDGARSYAGRVV